MAKQYKIKCSQNNQIRSFITCGDKVSINVRGQCLTDIPWIMAYHKGVMLPGWLYGLK